MTLVTITTDTLDGLAARAVTHRVQAHRARRLAAGLCARCGDE